MNKEITTSYLEEMFMECFSKSVKEAFEEHEDNKDKLYLTYEEYFNRNN